MACGCEGCRAQSPVFINKIGHIHKQIWQICKKLHLHFSLKWLEQSMCFYTIELNEIEKAYNSGWLVLCLVLRHIVKWWP